jgi:hypothetical protein
LTKAVITVIVCDILIHRALDFTCVTEIPKTLKETEPWRTQQISS